MGCRPFCDVQASRGGKDPWASRLHRPVLVSEHLPAPTFTQVVSFQSEYLGTGRWPGTGRFRVSILLNSGCTWNDAPPCGYSVTMSLWLSERLQADTVHLSSHENLRLFGYHCSVCSGRGMECVLGYPPRPWHSALQKLGHWFLCH